MHGPILSVYPRTATWSIPVFLAVKHNLQLVESNLRYLIVKVIVNDRKNNSCKQKKITVKNSIFHKV